MHLIEEIAQPPETKLPGSQFQIAPARFPHASDVHMSALEQVENDLALSCAVDFGIHGGTKKEALGGRRKRLRPSGHARRPSPRRSRDRYRLQKITPRVHSVGVLEVLSYRTDHSLLMADQWIHYLAQRLSVNTDDRLERANRKILRRADCEDIPQRQTERLSLNLEDIAGCGVYPVGKGESGGAKEMHVDVSRAAKERVLEVVLLEVMNA